jgi:hypothetical protein
VKSSIFVVYKNLKQTNMKKFEISAMFLGSIALDIVAIDEADAKQKFLVQLGTILNNYGEPSVTLANVSIPGANANGSTIVLDELNMCFPSKLTDADVENWSDFDIEEI